MQMYTFQGKSISAHLTRLAQNGNKPFSAMLNPDVEGVLGIRVPQLRALAMSIAADSSWREYVANADTEYMESRSLDTFTHNKAIQKICESLRVGAEQKAAVWRLKRKEGKK